MLTEEEVNKADAVFYGTDGTLVERWRAVAAWFASVLDAHDAALEAENRKLIAQGQADYRALHDALGWAHTDHGKTLPTPWRAITTIISERDTLRAELAEARATIARLTAAGQALSEHADRTAGGHEVGFCTCHMLQRDTQWHDTDCPARTHR